MRAKAHLVNWNMVVGFLVGLVAGGLLMLALNIAYLTGGM